MSSLDWDSIPTPKEQMLIDDTRKAMRNEDPKRSKSRLTQLTHHLVQARKEGHVDCDGCDQVEIPVWLAFRCYYCGFFYCPACAPGHFGQTRDEYFDDEHSPQNNSDAS